MSLHYYYHFHLKHLDNQQIHHHYLEMTNLLFHDYDYLDYQYYNYQHHECDLDQYYQYQNLQYEYDWVCRECVMEFVMLLKYEN